MLIREHQFVAGHCIHCGLACRPCVPREARGFFATLLPEQQERALRYRGPDNFTGEDISKYGAFDLGDCCI